MPYKRKRTYKKEMPYSRRYKRRYRRKSNKRPSTARLTRFTNGVAARTFLKLNYADSISFPVFNATTPGVVSLFYTGDRVNDPGITNDNHQPNQLPLWASVYRHYRVRASSIRVNFISQTTSPRAVSVRATSLFNQTPVSADTINQVMTDPQRKYRVIGDETSSKGYPSISMYRTGRNVIGNQSQYSGSTAETSVRNTSQVADTQNPNWQWQISCHDLEEIADTGNPGIRCLVKITYYVELFDRIDTDMTTIS